MGNEEEGDGAERKREKGVDNMFPLLVFTGRNNVTATLKCSSYPDLANTAFRAMHSLEIQ